VFAKEKSSTPTELVWYSNMAAISMFCNTTKAPLTSSQNALLCKIIRRKPKVPLESSIKKSRFPDLCIADIKEIMSNAIAEPQKSQNGNN